MLLSKPNRAALCGLVLAAAPDSFVLAAGSNAADIEPDAVMLRYPDVSQREIVFRYDSDLWIVAKEGGTARRITSGDGSEAFPHFSPAGDRIAFIANYDGGPDIYTLAIAGGIPERVTYHPGQEILSGWTPDGQSLLYASTEAADLARTPRMMRVSAEGGQPEALPPPYGIFGTLDETGDWLAYTPSTREFRTWKRYRGGLAQDIWLFHLRTLESRRLTDYEGTDAQPMWHGRELIFSSDRDAAGVLNLWSVNVDGGEPEQLTFFKEFGVRFASIGPQDVVFENGGRLYRLQLSDRQVVPVEVSIPGDRPGLRPIEHDLSKAIVGASAGPGTKRAIVEARGELFSVPIEEGVTRNLTRSDGVAERSPAWSPDGKHVAYFSDRSGEYELCLRRADGKPLDSQSASGSEPGGEPVYERSLTQFGAGWRQDPTWSPDSQKILFSGSDGSLWCYWLDEERYERLGINPSGSELQGNFAPTSDWVAWSHRHPESKLDAIYLYEFATGFTHVVTSGMFDDSQPCFDRSGEFLYFHSTRHFEPEYADLDTTWVYADTRRVLAVPLRADVKNPFAPEAEEHADEEEAGDDDRDGDKDDDDKDDDGDGDKDGEDSGDDQDEQSDQADADADQTQSDEDQSGEDESEAPKSTVIELEGFEGRAILLPIEHGSLGNLVGLDKALVYVRRSSQGESKLEFYELGEDEAKTVLDGVQGFEATSDGKHLFVATPAGMGFVAAAADQKLDKTLDLGGLRVIVDPRSEWEQMLNETWRLFRDFFYDEGMHGLDWPAVRTRYMAALADVTSRDDLTYLTGEMMAELNVGHAYNGRTRDGREDQAKAKSAGLLGADLVLEEGAYRIQRILSGGTYDADARSPLDRPDLDVAVGDWILSINGAPVDADRSFYAAMLGTAGEPTELVVNDKPLIDADARTIVVEPIESDGMLRMRHFIHTNREKVEELSGGRVGYIYVPNTGVDGQNELMRQFLAQRHKPALLIDERWNGGGQIPTRFIELLDRPVTNYWAVRHGEDWEWPPLGHRGPKAMLINGWAGSGGDAFPYYFRQAGLGKLIGRRTWGGLVGISGNPDLIDGTSHSIPTFGFYELDGTWGIEGHGVEPDIEVMDDPTALARGGDPQLEAGVAQLLAELEENPAVSTTRPAGPDRSGSGLVPADK